MQKIVFFDGACNLCAHSVQFIIKNDQSKSILFASLQSSFAARTLPTELTNKVSSVVFFDGNDYHTHARAVQHIARTMGGRWRILSWVMGWVPGFFSRFCYDVVAQRRYAWFGKRTVCWLPTPDVQQRFLS
jgi:predicted DCC family thiol-disulfide oxidoreductase YuxK